MRKSLVFFIILPLMTSLFIFSGCSKKQLYEPKRVHGSVEFGGSYGSSIVEATRSGATLEDGRVITLDREINIKILEGYRFLGVSKNYMLSTKNDGSLMVAPIESGFFTYEFKFEKHVASASAQDGILAVVFADNSLAIYSLEDKKLLFKQPGESSSALDMRITNPYFLNDLVIYPTLDGKLVIVDKKEFKVVRSIVIGSSDFFNNVIYFNVIEETLVAATPDAIFTLGGIQNRVSMSIRDMVFNEDGIWVATKDGRVVSLNSDLSLKKSIKLPFAHYMGIVVKDKIYLLEKAGHLIEVPKDLSSFRVFNLSIPEGLSFVTNDSFIVDDEYLRVK